MMEERLKMTAIQEELFSNIEYTDPLALQMPDSPEGRGAVFTRPEVVDFILDLVGYTADLPLHECRILEPAFGEGDFLLPIVDRLLASYESSTNRKTDIVEDLSRAILAFELHSDSASHTRSLLLELLSSHGVTDADAFQLIKAWIYYGDFLLADLPHTFTHAVGNPPYVRQELIPDALIAEYRARYKTIYDRADLYIPFMERCLGSLEPGGALGFICSDRWMKNRYGGPLRALVADQFHLAIYVDMVDTPAFHSNVIAYPAITLIKREAEGATRIARRPAIDRGSLELLSKALLAKKEDLDGSGVSEAEGVVRNGDPWLLDAPEQLKILRRLEENFPLLEEVGCKVGIGVATGADKVFIAPFDSLEVGKARKLPLVSTKDIESGIVQWKGLGVINPFRDDGGLVDLAKNPLLSNYLGRHADQIRRRNVSKKNPRSWYRTIDRIYPDLARRPKLLIPDIKGESHVVYEEGRLYPHHNLYYVTSEEWDLRALQAVLLSGIAKLFISMYSTEMRGGYLRFQAQYLRRIRLPLWKDVPGNLRKKLVAAAKKQDLDACNRAAYELFGLTTAETKIVNGLRKVA